MRISEDTLKEMYRQLGIHMNLCKIQTVRISKLNFSGLNTDGNRDRLEVLSKEAPTLKILLCKNLIQTSTENKTLANKRSTRRYYKDIINGHKSVTKTYYMLRQDFYWPTKKKDIQKIIEHCKVCQINKLRRIKVKQPMIVTDMPGETFEKIAMDMVGLLPLTKLGNKYILTIQYLLSKYVILTPLSKIEANDN